MGGRKDNMDQEIKKRLDTWVIENYSWVSKEIRTKIAKGQMAQFADDLVSHTFSDLYRWKDEKVVRLLDGGKLKWYLLTGAGVQLRSSTSSFYIKYRKLRMSAREDYSDSPMSNSNKGILTKVHEEYEDDLFECFMKEYDSLHWYLQSIMSKYWFENWSIAKIYEHYNISKTHLVKDINRAMNQIREKCKSC